MNTKSAFATICTMVMVFFLFHLIINNALAPAPAYGVDPVGSTTSERRGRLQLNPKKDVNLRACAGTRCDAIAIVRRGSFFVSTGRQEDIESDNGAVLRWIEVEIEKGSRCISDERSADGECVVWEDAANMRGWINSAHARKTPPNQEA